MEITMRYLEEGSRNRQMESVRLTRLKSPPEQRALCSVNPAVAEKDLSIKPQRSSRVTLKSRFKEPPG